MILRLTIKLTGRICNSRMSDILGLAQVKPDPLPFIETTTLSNAHKMIRLGVAAELRVGEQSQGSRTGMGMGRFRELFVVGCWSRFTNLFRLEQGTAILRVL